uniref:Lipase domain-containing protein n=1 Tax=Stomoxys calcitrans TaxID=35570 RepID=A0A1I8Q7I1_STOCA
MDDGGQAQVNGKNGWYIPNPNGSFEWFDNQALEKRLVDQNKFGKLEKVKNPTKFFLYSKVNPSEGTQITTNRKSVERSYFDANKPTYFLIHGWLNSYKTIFIEKIRNAMLRYEDCNVIVVDWPRARTGFFSAFFAVPGVGKQVATMIDFLHEQFGMSFETLTVVGHSYGGQVCGFTGKNVKTGKIHKIIGLDPAGIVFFYDKPEARLAITDAVYVQVIHTDAGKLGFKEPIGNSDFYVNGGNSQPLCGPEVIGICSHLLSCYYYAEVLELNDFGSIRCDDFEHAKMKNCGSIFSGVRMGARDVQEEVEGIFFVPVRFKYPFGVLNSTDTTNAFTTWSGN